MAKNQTPVNPSTEKGRTASPPPRPIQEVKPVKYNGGRVAPPPPPPKTKK